MLLRNHARYDSFGKITASSGSVSNPFRYTGRDFDSETGLYYYRARYYDSTTGRFLSEDAIRFTAGVDFYPYVSNSALNFHDPFGEFPTWWHRQVTNDLARAVFGAKCANKAKQVADSDASVDALNSGIGWGPIGTVIGGVQFLFHSGQGWSQPGPHFPSAPMLEQLHNQAMNTCSLDDLGKDLHSRQDSFAHDPYSSFDHYTHSLLSIGFGGPDAGAIRNAGLVDSTMLDTIRELSEFKSKCLTCCQ